MIIGGACGEAHFQSCDSRDVDQPAMAPNYPLVGVWTAVQPNERGGVSEPSRHRHAPAMMSGSRASAQISARRSKSSRVTRWRRSRSRASIRRKYSARESPWCSALASMVATTGGGGHVSYQNVRHWFPPTSLDIARYRKFSCPKTPAPDTHCPVLHQHRARPQHANYPGNRSTDSQDAVRHDCMTATMQSCSRSLGEQTMNSSLASR